MFKSDILQKEKIKDAYVWCIAGLKGNLDQEEKLSKKRWRLVMGKTRLCFRNLMQLISTRFSGKSNFLPLLVSKN